MRIGRRRRGRSKLRTSFRKILKSSPWTSPTMRGVSTKTLKSKSETGKKNRKTSSPNYCENEIISSTNCGAREFWLSTIRGGRPGRCSEATPKNIPTAVKSRTMILVWQMDIIPARTKWTTPRQCQRKRPTCRSGSKKSTIVSITNAPVRIRK